MISVYESKLIRSLRLSCMFIRGKLHLLILIMTLATLSSCKSAGFIPIAKVYKYFPPTQEAQIIYSEQELPSNAIYMGTIKMVPGDNMWPSNNFEKIKSSLYTEALKYGARFILITDLTRANTDYINIRLEGSLGDGINITAEIYH